MFLEIYITGFIVTIMICAFAEAVAKRKGKSPIFDDDMPPLPLVVILWPLFTVFAAIFVLLFFIVGLYRLFVKLFELFLDYIAK